MCCIASNDLFAAANGFPFVPIVVRTDDVTFGFSQILSSLGRHSRTSNEAHRDNDL